MKKELLITPLTMGISIANNSVLTFDKTEFTNNIYRSIYCKDINTSYFKMKSITADSVLDGVFFDLEIGDIIQFEFEALSNNNKGKLSLQLGHFIPPSTYATKIYNYDIPVTENTFKKYSVLINSDNRLDSNMKGIIYNIRNIDRTSEVIIQNLKIIVISNKDINIKPYGIDMSNYYDLKNSCSLYPTTSLYKQLNSSRKAFENGELTIVDNILKLNSTSSNFKGVASRIPTCKYDTPIVVSFDYLSNTDLKIGYGGEDSSGIWKDIYSIILPKTSSIKKIVKYFKPEQLKNIILYIGSFVTGTFEISNIKINILDYSINNLNYLTIFNECETLHQNRVLKIPQIRRFLIKKDDSLGEIPFMIRSDFGEDTGVLSIHNSKQLKLEFSEPFFGDTNTILLGQMTGDTGGNYNMRPSNGYKTYCYLNFFDNTNTPIALSLIPNGSHFYLVVFGEQTINI